MNFRPMRPPAILLPESVDVSKGALADMTNTAPQIVGKRVDESTPNGNAVFARLEAAKARKCFLSLSEELTNHGDDEVVRAHWCCAVLELTKDVEEEDVVQLASDAGLVWTTCPEILYTLLKDARQHKTCAVVQGTVCRMLRFLSYDPEHKAEIGAAGGITVILDAMNDHKHDDGVQAEACAALALLVHEERTLSQIGNSEAINRVAGAIAHERLQGDKVSLKWAMWALADMVQDSESQSQVAKNGALGDILNAMKEHSDCEHLQEAGCAVIAAACACDENKDFVGSMGAVAVVLRAMRTHINSAQVQHRCCRALGTLAFNEANRREIGNAEGIETITKTMKMHRRDEAVQEWGCKSLWILAYLAPHKTRIASAGGIRSVLESMRHHRESASVQQWGLMALWSIGDDVIDRLGSSGTSGTGSSAKSVWECANSKIQGQLAHEGGIEVVLTAMATHRTHAEVQHWGCTVLRNLACIPDVLPHWIAEKGGIEAIVEAMHAHQPHIEVQNAGCWTLGRLACADDLLRAKVVEKGGVRAIVAGMSEHKEVAGMQKDGCRTLAHLAGGGAGPAREESREKIGEQGGMAAILAAMDRHWANQEIQEWALRALSRLSENAENIRWLRRSDVRDCIFQAMLHYCHSDVVQSLGPRVLDNLKDLTTKFMELFQ